VLGATFPRTHAAIAGGPSRSGAKKSQQRSTAGQIQNLKTPGATRAKDTADGAHGDGGEDFAARAVMSGHYVHMRLICSQHFRLPYRIDTTGFVK